MNKCQMIWKNWSGYNPVFKVLNWLVKKLESLFHTGKIWNKSKTGKRILFIVSPVRMEEKTGTKQVIFRCEYENFRCGESNRAVDTKNRIGEGEKSQGR
jgi:hypothetical protein